MHDDKTMSRCMQLDHLINKSHSVLLHVNINVNQVWAYINFDAAIDFEN